MVSVLNSGASGPGTSELLGKPNKLQEGRRLTSQGGRVLPYTGYMYHCMCHCEGNGFQAVYPSIGYINQSIWV